MIPEEEYLAQHPEHSNIDPNELMTERIQHEKRQREALEKQREALLKNKTKLIADNRKRKDDLANLDKDLEKFIDVSYGPGLWFHPCCSDTSPRLRNQSRSFSTRSSEACHLVMCIIPRTRALR